MDKFDKIRQMENEYIQTDINMQNNIKNYYSAYTQINNDFLVNKESKLRNLDSKYTRC